MILNKNFGIQSRHDICFGYYLCQMVFMQTCACCEQMQNYKSRKGVTGSNAKKKTISIHFVFLTKVVYLNTTHIYEVKLFNVLFGKFNTILNFKF